MVERRVEATDVPGKDKPSPAIGHGHLHLDEGTSQHVAGIMKATPHARRWLKPVVAGHCLDQPQRPFDITFVVEGERRLVLRKTLAVCIRRILVLTLGRIIEEQSEQIGSSRGGEDRPLETFPGQPRQPAGVVDVSVGEHDGVDRVGRHGEVVPIPLAEMLFPLKKSAIDEHTGASDVEQVPRTRHHARSAEEGEAGSRAGCRCRWGHRRFLARRDGSVVMVTWCETRSGLRKMVVAALGRSRPSNAFLRR